MDFANIFQIILFLTIICHISLSNYTNYDKEDDDSTILRITGGRLAKLNEFQYQAALYLNVGDGFRFICGGTVYNLKFILTASHCLQIQESNQTRDPKDLRISVGNLEISDRVDASEEIIRGLLRVRRVYVHPQFSFGNSKIEMNSRTFYNLPRNDIGLLELENDLIFSESVKSVSIAYRNEIPTGKTNASGWGLTDIFLLPNSKQPVRDTVPLKVVQLEIYPRIICSARFGILLPDTWLCAGSLLMWESTCNGDSGGPLICKRNTTGESYLCGIVSNGQGCGLLLTPELNTDVGKFYDYIVGIAGTQ